MLAAVQRFIPVLTSEAGLCLTTENWQEVRVRSASYALERLLHKPGRDELKKIADLVRYLGCPGILVLNATSFVANKEGVYLFKSPYDGSKITCTYLELIELIHHLKPQAVLLPKKILQEYPHIWDNWNESITPFIHEKDLEMPILAQSHGVYFDNLKEVHWEYLDQWSHVPRYVLGYFGPEVLKELHQKGIEFIETDEPAKTAIEGRVYSQSGIVDLMDERTRVEFETIDSSCSCPTCTQQFTKAYLHHLFQHTPLLCYRFLIQHNVFYAQNR